MEALREKYVALSCPQIESAIYELSAGGIAQYIQQMRLAIQRAGIPDGLFKTRGSRFLAGETTITDLLADVSAESERDTIRHALARHLTSTEMIMSIELECYNETIRICKNADNYFQRLWSSPEFVNIYSIICGKVLNYVNPKSTTCLNYGDQITTKLLSGELVFADILLPEKELFPHAFSAERAEIETRLNQRVIRKESNLFKCPQCGVRKCTYQVVQRRALDEAPDYQCCCLDCGRSFLGRT